MMTADELTRLAIRHGTDKFGPHDYTPRYHSLLGHMRNRSLRMLEIGVGGYQDPECGGESLRTWRDYFHQGLIVGIDIAKKDLDLGQRIVVRQGSQVDPVFLNEIANRYGPFDIILDDGSHQNAHVVESFHLLFQHLRPGGIYIVEDLQTAFFPAYGGSIDMTEPNSVRFFSDLMASLAAGAPNVKGVAQMWRFHNIVALEKTGGANTAHPLAGKILNAKDINYEAISAALGSIQNGQDIRINCSGEFPEALRTRFVEIDHREISVFHPDAEFSEMAKEICTIQAWCGSVSMTKGANDYPSNYAFDIQHPEASAAFAICQAELSQNPSERGLQFFGEIAVKIGWKSGLLFAADILEAELTRHPKSLELIIRAANETNDAERLRRNLERASENHRHT